METLFFTILYLIIILFPVYLIKYIADNYNNKALWEKVKSKLFYIVILVTILIATNPSSEDHREKVLEEVKVNIRENIQTAPLDTKYISDRSRSQELLLKEIINKIVTRHNYLLFSVTHLTVFNQEENIGIGLLGHVYFFNKKFMSHSSIPSTFAQEVATPQVSVSENDILAKQERRRQLLATLDINHKYAYCDRGSLVTGMIEIMNSDHFFQMVQSHDGPTIKGRGTVQRSGNTLIFNTTSGIGVSGELRMYVLDDNRIVLITSKDAVYVQDDQLSFIKNMISTEPLKSKIEE